MTDSIESDNPDDTNDAVSDAPSITVVELKQLVDSAEDVFLFDVRTEPEYVANRLAFTDLRISHESVAANRHLLPEDKATPIYCFCRTGRRSGEITLYLKSIGYRNVFNVAGGIVHWQECGFETVTDATR